MVGILVPLAASVAPCLAYASVAMGGRLAKAVCRHLEPPPIVDHRHRPTGYLFRALERMRGFQRAGRRLIKRAIDHSGRAKADVLEGRQVAALGSSYRAVVVDEECDESILVASASPGVSLAPGTRLPVLAISGGPQLLGIEAAPPGRSGALPIEFQEAEASVGPTGEKAFIGLKLATYDPPNATVGVASFSADGDLIEILHAALAITGIEPPTEDDARRQLLTARSLVGVTGIPDGSIAFWTSDDTEALATRFRVHTIDIETGDVSGRTIAPGFTPDGGGTANIAGLGYYGDRIYLLAVWNNGSRAQIMSYPPDLSSQTIENDDEPGTLDFLLQTGAQFFESDNVIVPDVPFIEALVATDSWALFPFTTGIEFGNTFEPSLDPGGILGGHPYGLGLTDGKYWMMGIGDVSEPDFAIRPMFSTDIDDVANGWTDPELGSDTAFAQDWNGERESSYDYDRLGENIIGFPVSTALGPGGEDGTPGVMVLPVADGTTWADAAFVELDISTFRSDAVIGDGRP